MGSLKTLALAGSLAMCATVSQAADLLSAPPPPPEAIGLKGSLGSGIYLRGDAGIGALKVSRYEQQDISQAGGAFFGESSNQSFFAGAGVGYRFNNWFRVDGTLEYRGGSQIGINDHVSYNNPFGFVQQTNTYKGNLSSIVALFNAYVDLGTWNCLTPYIGAGIGYASNTISGLTDQGIVFAGGNTYSTLGTASKGDKGGLAWALMAGVGYEVNKNLTLELGYRYLNLGEAQTGTLRNAFLAETYAPLKAKTIESHDFRVGMRWNFGEPDCCGPVERPVAYAPAPMAPVIRKY